MLRSSQPHFERMALIWHDWFATGDVGSLKLGVRQKVTFRRRALGSFRRLLLDVTSRPGDADLAVGQPEQQVRAERELRPRADGAVLPRARATSPAIPTPRTTFASRPGRSPGGPTTGTTPSARPTSASSPACTTPAPRGSSASRADSTGGTRSSCASITRPTPGTSSSGSGATSCRRRPSRGTRLALQRLYKSSGHQIRPVVEAILMHPAFYEGPAMVKPPVIFIVGLLKARRRGIDTDSWVWISNLAGQQLFNPPNVAGWDESRWLDTSTLRGPLVGRDRDACGPIRSIPATPTTPTEGPKAAVDRALGYWGKPTITGTTRTQLERFSQRVESAIDASWQAAATTEGCGRTRFACCWPPPRTWRPADGPNLRMQRVLALAPACEAPPPRRDAGLPPIERGMPAPAGTGLSRRAFMLRSSAALLSVYGASRLGLKQLQEGIAKAAGGTDPVIVTVFMEGGIDALSRPGAGGGPRLPAASADPGARRRGPRSPRTTACTGTRRRPAWTPFTARES